MTHLKIVTHRAINLLGSTAYLLRACIHVFSTHYHKLAPLFEVYLLIPLPNDSLIYQFAKVPIYSALPLLLSSSLSRGVFALPGACSGDDWALEGARGTRIQTPPGS
jgi:hypothetical protein